MLRKPSIIIVLSEMWYLNFITSLPQTYKNFKCVPSTYLYWKIVLENIDIKMENILEIKYKKRHTVYKKQK